MSSQEPKRIVVIGGGIVGVSTVYFLTRHPLYDPAVHRITLLEASSIAAGSSGKGGGFLASWATPKCIAPLSFDLHRMLAQGHGGQEEWGYRAVSAAEVDLRAQEGQASSYHRVATKDTVPSDLDWLYPEGIETYNQVGTPQDSAQVHPFLFTNTIIRLAQERGANIVIGRATSINHNEGGKRALSVTYESRGETQVLDATDVLVAAGPWSSRLLPQVKLLAPKGHSMVIRPSIEQASPYILFTKIQSSTSTFSPDVYARPADTLNGFDTFYASGLDHYDDPLPDTASDIVVEAEKLDEIWNSVSAVSQEIKAGEIITAQACYKAQIWKHEENEEIGPMVGPLDISGLWLATGLDEWGVQNGPGIGLVVSEMIMEGKAKSADVQSLDPKHWM